MFFCQTNKALFSFDLCTQQSQQRVARIYPVGVETLHSGDESLAGQQTEIICRVTADCPAPVRPHCVSHLAHI